MDRERTTELTSFNGPTARAEATLVQPSRSPALVGPLPKMGPFEPGRRPKHFTQSPQQISQRD